MLMKNTFGFLFSLFFIFNTNINGEAFADESMHENVKLTLFGRSSLTSRDISRSFKKNEFVVEFYIKKTTTDETISYSAIARYGYLTENLLGTSRTSFARFNANKLYGESQLNHESLGWVNFQVTENESISFVLLGEFLGDTLDLYGDKNTTKPYRGFANFQETTIGGLNAYPLMILFKKETLFAEKYIFNFQAATF